MSGLIPQCGTATQFKVGFALATYERPDETAPDEAIARKTFCAKSMKTLTPLKRKFLAGLLILPLAAAAWAEGTNQFRGVYLEPGKKLNNGSRSPAIKSNRPSQKEFRKRVP